MGEVLLVWINYEKKTKEHECKIERITADKLGETADKRKRITAEEAERQIVAFARERGGVVRQAEVSMMLGLSERQTRDHLSGMAQRGVMEKIGANKDRKYKLK